MRVRVYKRFKGESTVIVEPSRRRRLPPVLLRGITPENRVERVLAAVIKVMGPPIAELGLAGRRPGHIGAGTLTTGPTRKEL